MNGTHGADPDGLDAFARSLEAAADRLRQILDDTRSLGDRVAWSGADADAFLRHLADDLGASVVRSSEAVRRAAEDVRRNANQQRQASGSGGSGDARPTGPVASPTSPSVTAGAAAAIGGWIGEASTGAIAGVLLGGTTPPADWASSPRVAALIDLVDGTPAAGAAMGAVLDGPDVASILGDLLRSDALPDAVTTSSWADQLFGMH